MNMQKTLKVMWVMSVLLASQVKAETVLDYLTDADGKYAGPSVEDNVAVMDTDKNGFADVSEVRAFLELKNGKGYQSALLEKLEASVKGASCASPFAKSFYLSK